MKSFKKIPYWAGLLIGVFDSGGASTHQDSVLQVIKDNLNCPKCEIRTYPLFDKNGRQTLGQTLEALNKAQREKVLVWNFSWNIPSSPHTQSIETKLNEIAKNSENIVLVAAGSKSSIPDFEASVWAKVPGSFVIGESSAQGNLHHQNTRSPKIFAIEKNKLGLRGSSYSVAAVTGQLATYAGSSYGEAPSGGAKDKKLSEVIAELKICKGKIPELYPLWSKVKSCLNLRPR